MAAAITRRQLFRLDLPRIFAGLRSSQHQGTALRPFRPPGALPESAFVERCERCHECSDACPFGVIRHLGPAAGRAEGTPIIEPNRNPCRWCKEMDCIRACPSGALTFEAGGKVRPIGTAHLDSSTCLVSEGILCDECVSVCPEELSAMLLDGRKPQVDETKCVGCGLCAFHCPSTPVSLRIVDAQQS